MVNNYSHSLNPMIPCNVFDIFDEIDALMTSVKSYIFSIGKTIDLPEGKMRLEVLRLITEVFLKKHLAKALKDKIASTEET